MSGWPAHRRVARRGSRGDLARLLGGGADLELGAALLGFEVVGRPDEPQTDPPTSPGLPERPLPSVESPPEPEGEAQASALHTPFWRVEKVEHLDTPRLPRETAEPPSGVTEEDRQNPGRSLLCRPRCPPIAPWAAVESRLREALSAEQVSPEPDLDAVMRALGQAEVLRHIPRRRRRAWPARLHLWVDRSPRHVTVEEDQAEVARRLVESCGGLSVVARILDAPTQGVLIAHQGHLLPKIPPPSGAVVLVLGDLGATSDVATALAWARTGALLARAGARPVALVPVGLDRLHPQVRAGWSAVAWQARAVPSCSSEERSARADRLLRLASPAALIQPGLLRALRLLLSTHEADAGTELDALGRPDIRYYDATGIVLTAEASRRLRDAFAAEESPSLRMAVSTLIRDWHRDLPAELLHAETLAWHARCPKVPPPGDVSKAIAFIGRVEVTVGTGGRDRETETWRMLAKATLSGLPESCYTHSELAPVFQRLWREVHRDEANVLVPVGVVPGGLRGEDAPLRRWAVRQVGATLQLEPHDATPNPAADPPRPGSPITTLDLRSHLWSWSTQGWCQHQFRSGLSVPLPDDRVGELMGKTTRVTLSPWTPEPWAVAAGRDQYGLWAALEVKGVQHRFRWIPPGRFWMGPQDDEEGMSRADGPRHEVELTCGCWLGETPVTQGLWTAVMGTNPSRFVSSNRPVEMVSWEESLQFCEVLNGQARGVAVRLPTEAEWERACRAGTNGATWLGDIRIVGANNAPALDEISWYGGNSGVGFELSNAYDSRVWTEKQHAHQRAGTRVVGEKAPNPWGLHDMLGNVYEWCADAYEVYMPDVIADPVVLVGSKRVIRGGSWSSDAYRLRAASRFAVSPVIRSADLGFRLALTSAPASKVGLFRATDTLQRLGKRRRGGRGALAQKGGNETVILAQAKTIVRKVHPLQGGEPPAWAVDWGQDHAGVFVSFVVGHVVHRLRWIPPGRFWMGSPEGEAGRQSVEGPRHEVELTAGFWLGETPVTQDLWESVIGSNPSRFVSPRRPVEQVSWYDSVQFCESLNGRVVGMEARLPTEAEWERACRAGTDGATWLGDLEILGANNAPVLDRIAWYGGNSGVGFDLSYGYDSSGMPEKRHEHVRAGTRLVGEKSSNPWGLSDMLGNVYEWCADAYASYDSQLRTDPVVRVGFERVFRGGSWVSNAHFVRAAARLSDSPEIRVAGLGLRLAVGPLPDSGAR